MLRWLALAGLVHWASAEGVHHTNATAQDDGWRWTFQRYDGWMNNANSREWGATETALAYLAPPAYDDGVYKPASSGKPDAGLVSAELLSGEEGLVPADAPAPFNFFFVSFGQMLSGEVMATISSGKTACPVEKMKVKMIHRRHCANDSVQGSALRCKHAKAYKVPQFRVAFDADSGRFVNNPRKPLNFRTAWIDASFLYSDKVLTVELLRAWDGTGTLKEDGSGNPLHNSMAGLLPNPPPPALHPHVAATERQFLLGSSKGNQEPALLALSFLFHRWHNHMARKLKAQHPAWGDEALFQVCPSLHPHVAATERQFLLGSSKGNQEPALLALSFLFHRWHNHMARKLKAQHPAWGDEALFQVCPSLHPHVAATERQFLLGSSKGNQEPALLALSFLFHRWHNHMARKLKAQHPAWGDEALFQVCPSLHPHVAATERQFLLGSSKGNQEPALLALSFLFHRWHNHMARKLKAQHPAWGDEALFQVCPSLHPHVAATERQFLLGSSKGNQEPALLALSFLFHRWHNHMARKLKAQHPAWGDEALFQVCPSLHPHVAATERQFLLGSSKGNQEPALLALSFLFHRWHNHMARKLKAQHPAWGDEALFQVCPSLHPHVAATERQFLLGSSKGNQEPALLALSFLFHRWHNHMARKLKAQHPAWGDEALFQVCPSLHPHVAATERQFLLGSSKGNQEPALLALSFLFHRWHNHMARKLKAQHPAWGDEALFQVCPSLHPHVAATERQFLLGSSKGNQEPALLALSFLFHRWHNHMARKLKAQHPAWGDEALFQVCPSLHPHVAATERQFLLGSSKGNQEPALLALSFLFHRWHNHMARKLKAQHPAWGDEALFQRARRWTVATLQQIVMYEFAPALLGEDLPPYRGYNPDLNPAVSVEFQAAAYRWGHSLVPSGFYVADAACNFTRLPFCQVWWNSQSVMEESGLEAVVRGMLAQKAEKGDHVLSEGLRERVFGGLKISQRDLGGLNVQRGREEGLADFNTVRHVLGLSRVPSWEELNPRLTRSDPGLIARAKELYGASMDNVDLFVGGLLESRPDGRPGPTFAAIIRDQLLRLRDADRFWFERSQPEGQFSAEELGLLKSFRMRDVVEAVTNLTAAQLGQDLFLVDTQGQTQRCVQPEQITAGNSGKCPLEPALFDFFSGSEVSFTASFVFLALFPLVVMAVCLGLGKIRARWPHMDCWRRSGKSQRAKEAAARRPSPGSLRRQPSLRRHSQKTLRTQFQAYEYNGVPSSTSKVERKEPFVSKARVSVEVNAGPVVVVSRSEVSKRVVDLSAAAKRHEIRLSEEKESTYVFQMSVPMCSDLILLFGTSEARGDFLAELDAEMLAAGQSWRSGFLPRDEVLAHAMTAAKREELLQDFFTTAFHQVHAAHEKQRGRSVARTLGYEGGGAKDLGRVRLLLQSRIPATLRSLTKLSSNRRAENAPAASQTPDMMGEEPMSEGRASFDEQTAESPRRVLRRALVSIELSRREFAEAMQLRPESTFVERMFRLADADGNGTISYPEFIDVLALFSKGSLESKMRMLFDMYDLDGSGDLDREEFAIMIRSLLEVTGKTGAGLSEADVLRMSSGMLHECGLADKTRISFGDFFHVITTHQTLIWNPSTAEAFGVTQTERKLSSSDVGEVSESPVLSEEEPVDEACWAALRRHCSELARRMENNWNQILWVFLYVAVSSVLFTYKFSAYQWYNEHMGTRAVVGAGASFSRGSAQVISFSLGLLLLTVCRNVLAVVRSSPLGYYIPVDSALTAHRWLAASIALMSIVHVVGHGVNFYQVSTQPPAVLACLFPDVHLPPDSLLKFHFWLFQTVPGVTGVALVLLMSVLYVFASASARRRIFPAFWTTHRLFIAILVLLFLHGSRGFLQPPQLHQFLALPLLLFVVDWVIRLRRHSLTLRIARAEPLPSGVLHLSLKKPRSLSYKSGQWVRVACDALSTAEFHPFTITSAPHEATLDVYIRSAGPWTKRMYALFKDPKTMQGPSIPRIILEGPYGSSHQDWFKFKAVVLVGAGIGVTPCASVIKDLVHKVYQQRSEVATRHVHFVWLSRGQQQFEWLLEVLREVEDLDVDGLVSVDIFVSQLLKDYDIRTMMLYMCEHQFQRLAGRSLFTGIRGRTHFGRIDLPAYLASIQRRHQGISKVGVFSCGPKSVVRTVDATCTALNKANVKPRLIAYHEIF